MPKTETDTRTREEIEAQAAELAAQLEGFRQQDQQRADEEDRRRAEARRKFDEELVKNYSYAQTELAVADARRALDDALANDPVVMALVAYQAALRRRYRLLMEHHDALRRLGRDAPATTPTLQTEVIGLEDMVLHLVERIGSEQVRAEVEQMHAERDAAGGDAT